MGRENGVPAKAALAPPEAVASTAESLDEKDARDVAEERQPYWLVEQHAYSIVHALWHGPP